MPPHGGRFPTLEQRAFDSSDALQLQNLGARLSFDEDVVILVTYAKHSWVFNVLQCYADRKKKKDNTEKLIVKQPVFRFALSLTWWTCQENRAPGQTLENI